MAELCGIDHRHGLDPMWLWRRMATAALIQPLAQELPYASGVALKKKNKKKKEGTLLMQLLLSALPG